MKKLLFCLGAALVLTACQSTPDTIPEGLSQAELFQRAQEAYFDNNFEAARLYYETFLDRYPDDTENRIAARYEIAFIYYKEGRLDEAEQRFQSILERYADAEESAESETDTGEGTGGGASDGSLTSDDGRGTQGGQAGAGSNGGVGQESGPLSGGTGGSGPTGGGFGESRAPGAQSQGLPQWPRVLAEKVLEKIEEERNQEGPLG